LDKTAGKYVPQICFYYGKSASNNTGEEITSVLCFLIMNHVGTNFP